MFKKRVRAGRPLLGADLKLSFKCFGVSLGLMALIYLCIGVPFFGNSVLVLYNGETSSSSGYSSNYARVTSCTISVTYIDAVVWYRDGSAWRQCTVWYRLNGAWVQVVPYYNSGGTWVRV